MMVRNDPVNTLALGGECAGTMHLGLFVCIFVRMCNSKTIAPIALVFLHSQYYSHSSVLL